LAKISENAVPDSSYAPQGFNRWLIPLAAVLVQVCIGSVYAWSTFNRPINAMFPPAPANSWLAWFKAPYITFSAALVLLGLSAAIGGSWVERHGPRATARAAAAFFGAGLVIGGIGLQIRQEWLVFLGMGVIGGIGGGLGYIAPVSTLVKWFPDRRGMATGIAIMGFGAGAFLAGYVNAFLIEHVGVAATLFALGVVYFIVMNIGAQIMRRPTPGWKPERWTPMPVANQIAPEASLTQKAAVRSYQFWLLWGMLFINVTAGIGILAQASPMMQDVFGKTALQASGVVSIISLFNAGGRFFWAALSDYIGRKTTYLLFFGLGLIGFLLIPRFGDAGEWLLFQIALYMVFTMYGGGFATIPAFLADIFGPNHVGAIHGAVLTAWSAAAIAGPVIITQLSDSAKLALAPGASKAHIYDQPLEVLAGLLVVGFVLTLLVKPLRTKGK